MAGNLIIVESPAKAGTIKGYLGNGYKVVASKGHVRDLPKSSLGIDVDNNFAAKYINIRGKGDLISSLKKEAKNADNVFLATDPDREGEAISWHLANALGIPEDKTKRIAFNEISKTAVKAAIKHPRTLDMNLVNSQQTRRLLDRLVGYKISPFLWKNVKSGLSAGRVQSVATRLIVEREEEITAFNPVEYWNIEALLSGKENKTFKSRFYGEDDKKIEINDQKQAQEIMNALEGASFKVKSVKKSVRMKNPAPPFITSTFQQEANRRLGFQSQRTMRVAQELYEGINLGTSMGGVQGLITYMRTDSQRISADASDAATVYIKGKYGEDYVPETPRVYKTKAGAQDAHEAIRPANLAYEPDKIKKNLTPDQYKIYKLIWERFIASQMQSAKLDTVSADITAASYLFKASGYSVRFPGYMTVYEESEDKNEDEDEKNSKLPELTEGEELKTVSVTPSQHFTQPPPRYTEASLIKALEEKGIGRPSTYTPTITTIIQRGYVEREGKAIKPTGLGVVITDIMRENFSDIVDYKFTATMEEELDEIEEGQLGMTDVLSKFYEGFRVSLEKAETNISKEELVIPQQLTDIICEKCGSTMVLKSGRFGKFAACPNYPECKNTKPVDASGKVIEKKEAEPVLTDMKCDLCGNPMVIRRGRYGNFYACSKYPECKGTKPIVKDIGVNCPQCGGKLVIKYGKNKSVFYSCEKYPECNFSTWDIPLPEKCPVCSSMLLRKKGKNVVYCYNKDCSFTEKRASTEGEG
ncbi:MAG: type I DNA topoisomerase [Eubacteriales bacterium]